MVDGICISGGEPTIQKGLDEFIKKCKEIGVKVKLDTNGSRPEIVEDLLKKQLLDYIAMDIKLPLEDYPKIVNRETDPAKLQKSIDLIKKYGNGVNQNGKFYKIDYEFRTTVMKDFHDHETIEKIMKLVGDSPYYLQNFEDSEFVFNHDLHGFTDTELKELEKWVQTKSAKAHVRGLKS